MTEVIPGDGGPLSPPELQACLALLQRLSDNFGALPYHQRLQSLISKLHSQGKRRLQGEEAEERRRRRQQDRALLANTRLVQAQQELPPPPALPGPAPPELHEPEDCYVCKQPYRQVHFFYHFLCPQCARFNYTMRDLRADLKGRRALITGGRVKIGYHLVLRLLRDGAQVLVTTRFPHAAAHRFHAEPDFAEWGERLRLYGLDLRNLPAVEAFAAHLLATEPHLDIVVHNAAQTIQRPPGFYRDLLAQEEKPKETLSLAERRLVLQPALPAPAGGSALLPVPSNRQADVLPLFEMHDQEERVDSRDINSWLLPIDQVAPREMLEVQLVNSISPFLLNGRLKPLLLRSPFPRRFIVNVSAMEGQFSRHKTDYHPHTNMAKAALNMMTHTCAAGYARQGIYMNSVDTGWVTDENPTPRRLRKQNEKGFFAPLDAVDGMARIYHPIAMGIQAEEEPLFGQFLKDYAPCKW